MMRFGAVPPRVPQIATATDYCRGRLLVHDGGVNGFPLMGDGAGYDEGVCIVEVGWCCFTCSVCCWMYTVGTF